MLRWLVYLCVLIPIQLLTWLITPILPFFSVIRVGSTSNNNDVGYELRLQHWLYWFDTPDNSLFGDDNWKKKYPIPTYISIVLWLYRNSLYGFKWEVLSLPEGHPDAWQWHKKYYFGKYYLDLNFGWMLDNIENGRAMFHFSPRLKRTIWTN